MSKIGQAVLKQIEDQEITVEQLIEKGLQNEVRV